MNNINMTKHVPILAAILLGLVVSACTTGTPSESKVAKGSTAGAESQLKNEAQEGENSIRFATFNTSLNRKEEGKLIADLEKGTAVQIRRVAEVIQRVRPDVVLLNEVDYDAEGKALKLFREKFLAVSQNEQKPIEYPHVYIAPVNTGVKSGIDINRDGKVALPDDGYGFGAFPGQYGMVVLSKFPIDEVNVRTFQNFLWKDMPGASIPIDPEKGKAFYPDDAFSKMRLSSKSHWDVPIQIDGKVVHLICAHPTPPVFDGPEDRNGCRNHNEIRMIADYVSNKADYLYDDKGVKGGLPVGEHFVIVGDMNADPIDGDSSGGAAQQLTQLPEINNSMTPSSKGAVNAAKTSGGMNTEQKGDPAFDTGDFNDRSVGNVRIDYCLPSVTFEIADCGVFWPAEGEPGFELYRASDHHMVWVNVKFKE